MSDRSDRSTVVRAVQRAGRSTRRRAHFAPPAHRESITTGTASRPSRRTVLTGLGAVLGSAVVADATCHLPSAQGAHQGPPSTPIAAPPVAPPSPDLTPAEAYAWLREQLAAKPYPTTRGTPLARWAFVVPDGDAGSHFGTGATRDEAIDAGARLAIDIFNGMGEHPGDLDDDETIAEVLASHVRSLVAIRVDAADDRAEGAFDGLLSPREDRPKIPARWSPGWLATPEERRAAREERAAALAARDAERATVRVLDPLDDARTQTRVCLMLSDLGVDDLSRVLDALDGCDLGDRARDALHGARAALVKHAVAGAA